MVTTDFILESVKAKKLLDTEQYLVYNQQKKEKDSKKIEEASELKSGKISIGITIYFFKDFHSYMVMVTEIFFNFLSGGSSPSKSTRFIKPQVCEEHVHSGRPHTIINNSIFQNANVISFQ